MTTYAWPTTGGSFLQAAASIGFAQNQRISTSTLNGTVQTTNLPGARLRQTITFPRQSYAVRAPLEALLNRLNGMEHRLSLYDVSRQVPRGTCNLVGVTVSAFTAQFGISLPLTGCGAGKTLLAGDWIKVSTSTGAQVLQVVADATASGTGAMTVEVRANLRGSVAAASAVTLDTPTALYVLQEADGLMVPRGAANICPEFTAQFMEVFA
jgi:hypothetical protein